MPLAVAVVVLLLAAGVTIAVVAFSSGGAVAVTGEASHGDASQSASGHGESGHGEAGVSGAQGQTASGGAAAAPQSQEVFVHVVGAVATPGVVALPSGSRVEEAVARAGGASDSADLSGVNLARAVVDGEQLRIPAIGEPPPPGAAPSVPGASTGGIANGSPGGPLNLNAATEAELDALPGIGPALASRIVEWRTANGKFLSAEQLDEVSGIGPKLLERLLPLVGV